MTQKQFGWKMKIRSCGVLLIVTALLFSAAGCGGRSTVKDGNLDPDTNLVDLNISGNIVFTINNESGTETEGMAPRSFAEAFMSAYPGTTVTVREIKRDQYAQQVSAGTIGDVFWCDEPMANTFHLEHNAIMPLDAYLKPLNIDIQQVYKGAIDCGMIEGRLYMAPRTMSQQTLIYNVDALREAGFLSEVAAGDALTWTRFSEICRSLNQSNPDGTYTQVGAAMKTWWFPVLVSFLEGWGGTWVDQEEKHVSFTSDPLVFQGLSELFQAMNDGWLYPEDLGYSGDKNTAYANLSAYNYVFRTFGTITWLTRYGNDYASAAIDWDICPFPQMPVHKVGAGATGYVVYNRTANPDTAAAFALFFLTEDGQLAYHGQTGGEIPLLSTLSEDPFWRGQGTPWPEKNYDAFISYPSATTPATAVVQVPPVVADLISDNNLRTLFQKILANEISMESAFSTLETQANELWARIS